MEYVKSFYKKAEINFVNVMFKLFWVYNYYLVVIEEKLRPYGFMSEYLKQLFVTTSQKTEPNLDTWNCTIMVNMNLETPKLIEQYKYDTKEEYAESVKTTVVDFDEVLLLRKCENYRLSKINIKGVEKPAFADIPNPNNTRFLNIMYFHKTMSEPIKINLDLTYIRNGNEIFSKTFIYRMLCYQYNPGDYVFDDSYELHLMDDKIHKHTLTASKYLQFDDRLKAGYKIC